MSEPHAGFRGWVADNADRIADARERGTLPYFIRDNRAAVERAMQSRTSPLEIAKQRHEVRTAEQAKAIQQAWTERKAVKHFGENMLRVMGEIADIDTSKLQTALKGGDIALIQNEARNLKAIGKEITALKYLDNPLSVARQFSMQEAKTVNAAIEAKLSTFKGLSLTEQTDKLKFEIEWVGDKKKYSTWKVAQEGYKKQLAKVEYQIAKKEIETDTLTALDFAKTTKSKKIKTLATELDIMMKTDKPIAELRKKADMLNKEVARLENKTILKASKSLSDELAKYGYTKDEIIKYIDLQSKIDTALLKHGGDILDNDVINASKKMTDYVHSLSDKYYHLQKSVLTSVQEKASSEALKKYLAEGGINPNDIFGSKIGGVYDRLLKQRLEYAKELTNVTADELSLITRFTNGSTFTNAYNLRHISPYWKNMWERKIANLTKAEIKDIERVIEEYTQAMNGTINKLKRYNGTVYRGIRYDGGNEIINQFNELWKSGKKEWVNPNHASSSTNQKVAKGFDDAYDGSLILIIKNKTGGYIAPVSEYQTELEVILMKGAKYKMLKAPYRLDGKMFVELVEI